MNKNINKTLPEDVMTMIFRDYLNVFIDIESPIWLVCKDWYRQSKSIMRLVWKTKNIPNRMCISQTQTHTLPAKDAFFLGFEKGFSPVQTPPGSILRLLPMHGDNIACVLYRSVSESS